MQDKRKIATSIPASLSLLFSLFVFFPATEVHALMSVPYGWYFDANVGYTKLLDFTLQNGGSTKPNGVGGSLGLGYKFMPYFGMELGYTKYADSKVTDSFGNNAGELKMYSYDLTTKAIMPVYDSGMELFAKLGIQRAHTRFSINNLAAANSIGINGSTRSHTGIYLGVGGQYYFMPELAVVGQWTRAQGNGDVGTLDLYSVGVTFSFG